MDTFIFQFEEQQVAIILQALQHYMYNNPHLSDEQWEIANSVVEKIDEDI